MHVDVFVVRKDVPPFEQVFNKGKDKNVVGLP